MCTMISASLLRLLEVHPRLDGEILHHFLLLQGEGGHGVDRGFRLWDEEHRLSLLGAEVTHKQLIIHNTKTGGNMGS